MDRKNIARLEDVPNVGPAIAARLRRIDILEASDLVGRDQYARALAGARPPRIIIVH